SRLFASFFLFVFCKSRGKANLLATAFLDKKLHEPSSSSSFRRRRRRRRILFSATFLCFNKE
ncbi:hypothetical protein CSUI_008816, partial [Cystoisospora suis]